MRLVESEDPEEDRDIGAINDLVGFHVRLAYGVVYRHFMETFADLDLTQKQVAVMWLVSDHPGIGQSDLARRLQMDRATVMAIVKRLEGRGYLARTAHDGDARRRALSLTPVGVSALEKARSAILEHESWLTARFTPREVKQLIGLLSRIHG